MPQRESFLEQFFRAAPIADTCLVRLLPDSVLWQAAANQLFESTSDLPTEAVLGMMSSLRDISTRMLSAPAVRPNHVRLYALERLVEILLVNSHRVQVESSAIPVCPSPVRHNCLPGG